MHHRWAARRTGAVAVVPADSLNELEEHRARE
jgi:hypothetical protein